MKYFLVLISALIAASSFAEIKPDETIHYTLSNAGGFDVVYHRTDSAGTGVVIGGLLGGAIQTGHQNSKDSEKLEEIRPHISLSSCGEITLASFEKKIASKEISAEKIEPSQKVEKGELLLKIGIDACGFKLTNTTNKLLSGFVLGKIELKRKGQSEAIYKERLYLTGKKEVLFQQLLDEPELIDTHIEKVLKKAGRRIANKIIYL